MAVGKIGAAYEALSPAMLDGLTARHSTEMILQKPRERGNTSYDSEQDKVAGRSHPIVTVDPRSGKRRLAVQHYAVADYTTRRRMQRVTLLGSPPVGVADAMVSEAA